MAPRPIGQGTEIKMIVDELPGRREHLARIAASCNAQIATRPAEEGNIERAIAGHPIGTLVSETT